MKIAVVEVLHACDTVARTKPAQGTPQFEARAELLKRCGGIYKSKQAGVRRRALELQAAIDTDDSQLGKLTDFSQRSLASKQRLQQDDLQMLTDAFQSQDLLLVKEASRAMFALRPS